MCSWHLEPRAAHSRCSDSAAGELCQVKHYAPPLNGRPGLEAHAGSEPVSSTGLLHKVCTEVEITFRMKKDEPNLDLMWSHL